MTSDTPRIIYAGTLIDGTGAPPIKAAAVDKLPDGLQERYETLHQMRRLGARIVLRGATGRHSVPLAGSAAGGNAHLWTQKTDTSRHQLSTATDVLIDAAASDLVGSRWPLPPGNPNVCTVLPEVRCHDRYHDLPRTPDEHRPPRVSSSRRSPS